MPAEFLMFIWKMPLTFFMFSFFSSGDIYDQHELDWPVHVNDSGFAHLLQTFLDLIKDLGRRV